MTFATTSASGAGDQSRLVCEDLFVPACDPGITLYVRNKRPAELDAVRPARPVLFVHVANAG